MKLTVDTAPVTGRYSSPFGADADLKPSATADLTWWKEIEVTRRAILQMTVLSIVGISVCAGIYSRVYRRCGLRQNRSNAPLSPTTNTSQDDGMAELMGADLRGKPAPDFILKDIDGQKVSLADHKGRAVVVNFWATYCGPCKLEMPWFEQLEAKYRDQGLVILGIDQDEGAAQAEISTIAKHAGVSYPILMPDDTVSKNYGGVDYLPETFYINRNGIVVMQTTGAPTKNEIEANIRKTLAAGN